MERETVLFVGASEPELTKLKGVFDANGCRVLSESYGEECFRMASVEYPSVVLFFPPDVSSDRVDSIGRLRESLESGQAAFVVISDRHDSCTSTNCREVGADECVYMPLDGEKLCDRVRLVLRRRRLRASVPPGVRIERDGLMLDTDKFEVVVGGHRVGLNLSQFQLLYALASEPGKVLSREQLLQRMQRLGRVDERIIDVHVRAIRKRLKDARALIVTVRGVGYKLDTSVLSAIGR